MSDRFLLRVRFADIDHGGVMYYPTIIHYFHQALEDWYADVLGLPIPTMINRDRVGLPTVSCQVDYRRPFRFGDTMEVEVRVVKVGVGSLTYQFIGRHLGEERPSAQAEVQSACIDMDHFSARPFPDALRTALEARRVEALPRLGRG